ncbi:MAG: HAMP domain-containing sensor histidine kinase [Romboutsia sp.]
MKQELFRKIFKNISIIILCAAIGTIVFGGSALKNYFLRTQLEEIEIKAKVIAKNFSSEKDKVREIVNKNVLDSSIVIHYDKSKNNIMRIEKFDDKSIYREITNEQLNRALNSFIDIVLSGKSINGITQLSGIKGDSIVVGEPIKDENNIDGCIIFIKFPTDLTKVLSGLYIVLTTTIILALILILAPIYLYMQRIFKPLNDMSKAAIFMSEGDFSIRIDESGNDEIGELAKSINFLAKQLEENNNKAIMLEQTRRDYVANVSHELKTPVTAIRAVAEILNDDLIRDRIDKEKYYKQILRESMRLERLIKDMLELSRLQSSSISLIKSVTPLEDILINIIDEFEVIADDMGVEFIVPSSLYKLPKVYTNKDRIIQVLIILLDNAFKFTTEDGKVLLDIKYRDEFVEVCVCDNGVGISKEDIPFIFDRFYKVDKSHSSNGTGIGLSIVWEILKHLDEEIYVESEVGKGSKFIFTIKYYTE